MSVLFNKTEKPLFMRKILNRFIHSRSVARVPALLAQLFSAAAGSVKAQCTATASGTFGAGLSWTLCGDGTLTVGGTGVMPDYTLVYRPPWYPHRSSITSVVIEPGVQSVGRYAFYGYSGVTSASIPESVTDIRDYAFEKCNLASVHIPKNVAAIGVAAFSFNANLTSITVHPDNTDFKVTDGALLSYNGKRLFLYPVGNAGSAYTVPAPVETIEWYAFVGSIHLTSVTFPASLKTIIANAFYGCTGLSSISIPASVTDIDDFAFAYCTALTDVTLNSATPPGDSDFIFYYVNRNSITLHIPAGAESAYASAGWTGFKGACTAETIPFFQNPEPFRG
jgi:hypothetical protein